MKKHISLLLSAALFSNCGIDYQYHENRTSRSDEEGATYAEYSAQLMENNAIAHPPMPHAVRRAGPHTLLYDLNGNMVLSSKGTRIDYNGNNFPTRVNNTHYKYNGRDQRIEKSTHGNKTLYPFGDDFEYNPTQNKATIYLSIGENRTSAGPRIKIEKRGEQWRKFWLHLDHQGSIRKISKTSGSVVQSYDYELFGRKKNILSQNHEESRSFTGQRQDDENGLIYLHARYFDPEIGRFISPDTKVSSDTSQGLNRYSYALNDPVNLEDRSGNSPFFYLAFYAITLVGSAYGYIKNGEQGVRNTISLAMSFTPAGSITNAILNHKKGDSDFGVAFSIVSTVIGKLGYSTNLRSFVAKKIGGYAKTANTIYGYAKKFSGVAGNSSMQYSPVHHLGSLPPSNYSFSSGNGTSFAHLGSPVFSNWEQSKAPLSQSFRSATADFFSHQIAPVSSSANNNSFFSPLPLLSGTLGQQNSSQNFWNSVLQPLR